MFRFNFFERNNGKHYYRLIADSGHSVIASDGYVDLKDCYTAARLLKMQIKKDENIVLEETTSDEYKFKVLGPDKSNIGYSMPFRSEKQCMKWINLLREFLSKPAAFNFDYQT